MLAAMRVEKLASGPINSLPELEQWLLQRIPAPQRNRFFTPPEPGQLSPRELGLDEVSIQLASERVVKAIADQEAVLIFGDYDCDGVTATAILWETLRQRGLLARPFLPHRQRHGYGLSVKALEDIWLQYQPKLVITVDNGIVAHEAVNWLQERGAQVLITDHHEPGDSVPPADFILHSQQLCGASVAWTLANALDPEFAQKQLDLAAIGTIADQVPLYGVNRSFAWHGLNALRRTTRPSLLALAEVAGLQLSSASASTVHFGLAPRINAMGRLYDALDALRALVSRSPERTRQLMAQLQAANLERQGITQSAVEEVTAQLSIHNPESIVVVAGQFHEGVIGLIASKLVDLTQKPSIVITTGEDYAKASCRSVPGFQITDFLRSLAGIQFLSLGGHAMAAGFSIVPDQVEQVMLAIRQRAKTSVPAQLLVPSLKVVGELSGELLRRTTPEALEQFAPFGAGNPEPLFLLPQAKILGLRPVGRGGQHAQLNIEYQGKTYQAICFGYHNKEVRPAAGADLVVKLEASLYRNKELEIQVQAVSLNGVG